MIHTPFLSLQRMHNVSRRCLLIALIAFVPGPFGRASWTNFESGTRNGIPYTSATWTGSGETLYVYSSDGPNSDDDSDGLTGMQEYAASTDPFNIDTDYDGLTDGDEVNLTNSNPTTWDSDNDGYSDYDESQTFLGVNYGTPGVLPNIPGATYYDYDGDGVKNPVDPYPLDSTDNNADSDFDGVPDYQDPYPADYSNYSTINGIAWTEEVLGDADDDGILNHADIYPYLYYNDPTGDGDGDGIPNQLDPAERDPVNYSSINNYQWGYEALFDRDGDSVANFYDNAPDLPDAGDWDEDGFLNGVDPAPYDHQNVSSINGFEWGGFALDDLDYDGIINFKDPTPFYDPDTDGDGMSDGLDPAHQDPTNYSSRNSTAWYANALNDNDGDGTKNFYDYYPSDPYDGDTDKDDDGFTNDIDPAITDSTNHSSINNISWYYNALGDYDGDSTANFNDSTPEGSNPGSDSDHDGIANGIDPFLNDIYNLSPVNGLPWYGNVLGDADNDGVPNHADIWPHDASNGMNLDADGDGLTAAQEYEAGSSDGDVDSDDDGLTDYEEVSLYHSSPINAYSIAEAQGTPDAYGYSDYYLVDSTDTDNDEIPDRIELFYDLNPSNAADGWGDLDGNGVINRVQYQFGFHLNIGSTVYDLDCDGMTNIFEELYNFDVTNPNDAIGDVDNDKLFNYEEARLSLDPYYADTRGIGGYGDWQVWLNREYPTNVANITDTNSNGKPDWAEALAAQPWWSPVSPSDWDGDGLPNLWEHRYGRWKYALNGLLIRTNDAADDPDADNRSNLYEFNHGTNPLIGTPWQGDPPGGVTPADGVSGTLDGDGDGMPDADEPAAGNDPNDWDTDNDGIADGAEAKAGNGTYQLRVFTPLIRPIY